MILSDRLIRAARLRGDIVIEPFDEAALGTNSYDVHLGPKLLVYERTVPGRIAEYYDDDSIDDEPLILDAKTSNPTREIDIRTPVRGVDNGFVLYPNKLYLGSTIEYTETHKHVPFLDGKSSIGRLGITIHCTAGRGDCLYKGHWTLEIHVVHPVRIYAGMPIGQLIFFETGQVDVPYDQKPNAKYLDGRNPDPQASRMWMNFPKPEE